MAYSHIMRYYLVLCLLVLTIGCFQPALEEGRLNVKVQGINGPISGASVKVYGPQGTLVKTRTTDLNGEANFNLSSGEYLVSVDASNYEGQEDQLLIQKGRNQLADFFLEKTVFCEENWNCTEWSQCLNGTQYRTCIDENECGTQEEKPSEKKDCIRPECFRNYECIDEDPCTIDECVLNSCSNQKKTVCESEDGCCPEGCEYAEDNDCPEPPECKENSDCTSPNPCYSAFCDDGECDYVEINACIDDDGCCPKGCTDDTDCDEQGNECEDASDCPEGESCTEPDCLNGYCVTVQVISCVNNDGCCPLGCEGKDNDCQETECDDDEDCEENQKCADSSCVLMTCSEQQGSICQSNEMCPFEFLEASDTSSCCPEECVPESSEDDLYIISDSIEIWGEQEDEIPVCSYNNKDNHIWFQFNSTFLDELDTDIDFEVSVDGEKVDFDFTETIEPGLNTVHADNIPSVAGRTLEITIDKNNDVNENNEQNNLASIQPDFDLMDLYIDNVTYLDSQQELEIIIKRDQVTGDCPGFWVRVTSDQGTNYPHSRDGFGYQGDPKLARTTLSVSSEPQNLQVFVDPDNLIKETDESNNEYTS